MTKKAAFWVFFLFCANALHAQDKLVIDSLYRAFHAAQDPIKKIDLLYDIANEQDDAGNPDTGFRYADSLELLSKAAHYKKGLASFRHARLGAWAKRGICCLAAFLSSTIGSIFRN